MAPRQFQKDHALQDRGIVKEGQGVRGVHARERLGQFPPVDVVLIREKAYSSTDITGGGGCTGRNRGRPVSRVVVRRDRSAYAYKSEQDVIIASGGAGPTG